MLPDSGTSSWLLPAASACWAACALVRQWFKSAPDRESVAAEIDDIHNANNDKSEMATMNTSPKSLEELMQEALGEGGVLVSGLRGKHMEVSESANRMVWMTRSPVEQADFDALEVDASYTKSGIGPASMDRAGFRHSPDLPEEPVREREIGGHQFINVALPFEMKPPSQTDGPITAFVNKAHVLGFDAGRRLAILTTPEGNYVEVVGDASDDAGRILPEGGELNEIVLNDPWVVLLPTPTRAFFWWHGSIRSFQGPVTLPAS
jgi:hypothetical protein